MRSLPSVTLEQLGLSELEITAAELPPLTLGQYVDLLSGVPLPTQQQKQNFVEYVSHAHSWYKHLPLYPPGAPFYFFLDKYAGCDRLVSRDGTAILRERTEGGFHYSDYPTAKYVQSPLAGPMAKDPQEIDWPEESGGQVTLERILSRSEKVLLNAQAMEPLLINLPATRGLATVDGILYKLLTPERTRQYREMMNAIDQVCELIAASRT